MSAEVVVERPLSLTEPLPPECWPVVDHLVTEDDTPVDGLYSERQMRLLTETLYSSWPGPGNNRPFVAMANVGLFCSDRQPAVVPDVLVSIDVKAPEDPKPKKYRSYFIWHYGKPPDLVLEVVSNTEGEELTFKLEKYATIMVPYYVVWDPDECLKRGRLQVFLNQGGIYVPLDKPFFPRLGLGVRTWQGNYQGMEEEWLRWCDANGQLLLTGAERAEHEHQRAEHEHERAQHERQRALQEHERAEHERQRAERLLAQMRALGIEPPPE